MKRAFVLLLLGLPMPACRQAPTEDRSLDRLLVLMGQRLEVMHDVARYKWARKSPIEDPARERALLDDVAEGGRRLGLGPETTRSFFAAQIEAAKLVQRADFRRWEAGGNGPPGETPDLAGVLRPRIDALNRELLSALGEALRAGRLAAAVIRRRADRLLDGEGIDAEVRNTAIRPLIQAVE